MYFWENSLTRAQEYAQELATKRQKIKAPFVIGAVINLGYCFDLTDAFSLNLLETEYQNMAKLFAKADVPMPENQQVFKNDTDFLFRKLDCAVIEYMHQMIDEENRKAFDTVRGVFWEGDPLYPTSGFKKKNHVQLCIRNPNAIKGYFRPLDINPNYDLV